MKKRIDPAIYNTSGRADRERVILTGRLVTEGHEPRQVRKEAAISDFSVSRIDPGYAISILPSAGRIFSFRALSFIS